MKSFLLFLLSASATITLGLGLPSLPIFLYVYYHPHAPDTTTTLSEVNFTPSFTAGLIFVFLLSIALLMLTALTFARWLDFQEGTPPDSFSSNTQQVQIVFMSFFRALSFALLFAACVGALTYYVTSTHR